MPGRAQAFRCLDFASNAKQNKRTIEQQNQLLRDGKDSKGYVKKPPNENMGACVVDEGAVRFSD